MTTLYKIISILVLAYIGQISFGQLIIDKDSAILIAIENGLEQGLEAPTAELVNDIWEIKCLLCAELHESNTQIIKLHSKTGEIIDNSGIMTMSIPCGRQFDKTTVSFPNNSDSLQKNKITNSPERLTGLSYGNESNPKFSPDNSMIAFQNNLDIYIINIRSQIEKQICNDCYGSEWLDNQWLSYSLREENMLYKKNIESGEQIIISDKLIHSIQNGISGKNGWIAYTSSEVWNAPSFDDKGNRMLYHFINGNDQELCLYSKTTGERKYVTKTGKYVHYPSWSQTRDTLFFYIENDKYYIDDFESDTILYLRYYGLEKMALRDYQKIRLGQFPLKHDCKIYSIDSKTLCPIAVLIDKRGRYDNLIFSDDLKYLLYTEKDCRNCDDKLWILNLK